MKLKKKGNVFGQMGGLTVALVSFCLIIVIGFLVMANVQDQIVSVDSVDESNASTFSTSYNASVEMQDALEDVPGWAPLIVIVVIGALVLMLVKQFKG